MKNLAVLPSLLVCMMLVAMSTPSANAQWDGGTTTGADVIVGDIVGTTNYSAVGSIDAFSCGTTSCNIGDTPLDWIDNTNLHPVIGQNAYRLYNNRFVQIGQSWLKHGFLALNGGLCSTCQTTPTTSLGVGCSDPYGSSLNGSQGGLGPKFEVNAASGFYLWPYTGDGVTGNSIYKRLQIKSADLGIAGAQYFIEAQYVAHDDSSDGNSANSASWRPGNFTLSSGSNYNLSLTGSTQRGEPAIYAWQAADPNVQIKSYDIVGDGRFNVGLLLTDNGNGTFTYEYAIHNQTSDRSAFKFEVPTAPGATITNIGFHDVDYHSGEPFSGTDWATSVSGGTVTWTTDDFATNPNANALRWGTLYNFRFTTDVAAGDATLHLFKPGAQPTLTVSFAPAAFTFNYPNGLPTSIADDGSTTVVVGTSNLGGAPDASTAQIFVSVNGGGFTPSAMTDLGGGDFEGSFPALPCGSTLDWYVSIAPLGGGAALTDPEGAPAAFHSAVSATMPAVLSSDNAETNMGFTVSGNATDGQWDRGIPVNNDRLDPPSDSDGSGQCWLTDNDPNGSNSDVDNGTTILTSPVYDMFELTEARISFDLWYSKSGSDSMQIEISNGGAWVQVENITSSLGGWSARDIRVSDFVTPNSTVQFRLLVSDVGNQEIVEAGLDNIRVSTCLDFSETIAAGTVGVGANNAPEQVLLINGSNGGPTRTVGLGFGQSLSFSMLQPSTNAFSSQFIVWGASLPPAPSLAFTFPAGIGKMAFPPCEADPLNPSLFLLTDNSMTSVCAGLMGSTGTPWTETFPLGLNFEVDVQLQGIVIDPSAPLSLGITNMVRLRISALL